MQSSSMAPNDLKINEVNKKVSQNQLEDQHDGRRQPWVSALLNV